MRNFDMVVVGDGQTLARMHVEQIEDFSSGQESANFKVTLRVDRGAEVYGSYVRVLEDFPINALNAVALIKAALNTFTSDSLVAEDDDSNSDTSPSDMERELGRTMYALPTEAESRVRNNRPAVWS